MKYKKQQASIQYLQKAIIQIINLIVKNLIVSMDSLKRIDKYQVNLKKKLGEGSFASVYLGWHIESGQNVAVKVIDRKHFMNSYNLKSLQSQIQIMKKVQHENIVKLYDVYQTANNMYIIAEYCQQGDLSRYLERHDKKISESQAKRLIKQIMKGAKYLHHNGIIHRDLKPANILIKNGICKIADFGFAKNLSNNNAILKSIVGTPLYMSPQLLKGTKYTSKSDLWSIGLIYYQMLHGRTPWVANNEIQLLNAINTRKPVFSRQITQISIDFIEKCLQVAQRDRMSWDQAFEHKLLKEFSRAPKDYSIQQLDKQNINDSSFIGQLKQITYIKNLPVSPRNDLSEKALGRLLQMTPSKKKFQRTPSRSQTVAKFAGSRRLAFTPRNNVKSPVPFRN